jgi:ParB-like chromosome segregation protein Spo0J
MERKMLRDQSLPIADIYVPAKHRSSIDPETVRQLAESIMAEGQQTPILVRRDGERLVLVEGVHRLEACKALGETTIRGLLVQARRT